MHPFRIQASSRFGRAIALSIGIHIHVGDRWSQGLLFNHDGKHGYFTVQASVKPRSYRACDGGATRHWDLFCLQTTRMHRLVCTCTVHKSYEWTSTHRIAPHYNMICRLFICAISWENFQNQREYKYGHLRLVTINAENIDTVVVSSHNVTMWQIPALSISSVNEDWLATVWTVLC